jgi:hypothetical protein
MTDQRIQNSALFLEVHEYDYNLPSHPVIMNPNDLLIMGWINLIAGLVFSFIAISAGLVPFGFLVAGLAVSSFVNAAGMFTAYDAMTGGLGGIGNGIITIFKPIIDAIVWIGTGLYSIGLKLIEAIKFMGNFLMENGAAILEAFVEIIYFIVFLLVLLGWSLFLSLMRFILHGDFEGAWRFFRRGMLNPVLKTAKKTERFAEKQTVGRYKKVEKWRRGGEGFRANQSRQDRKTRSYESAESARGESYREQQEWYKKRNETYQNR